VAANHRGRRNLRLHAPGTASVLSETRSYGRAPRMGRSFFPADNAAFGRKSLVESHQKSLKVDHHAGLFARGRLLPRPPSGRSVGLPVLARPCSIARFFE
jgi:hypothetical protein